MAYAVDTLQTNVGNGPFIQAIKRDDNVYFPTANLYGPNVAGTDLLPVNVSDANRLLVEQSAAAFQTATKSIAATTVTGNIVTPGAGELILLVLGGHNTVEMAVSGTFVATIVLERSLDGGTTWNPLFGTRTDSLAAPSSGFASVGVIKAAVQAGSLVRARVSAFTSGSAIIRLSTSFGGGEPVVSVTGGAIGINSGSQVIGSVRLGGIWYDDTITNLGASATFTSTARDLTGAITTGNLVGAGFLGEFRAMAVASHPFTFHLEVSRDAATWYRVRSYQAGNTDTNIVGTGAVYTAAINYFPTMRYARVVQINAATAQTSNLVQTVTRA